MQDGTLLSVLYLLWKCMRVLPCSMAHRMTGVHVLGNVQEDKVSRAIHNYAGQIKEVDVKLSVAGGDRGLGAKQQKTEITIYTLRSGVVRYHHLLVISFSDYLHSSLVNLS
jgi:hypothetical protein